MEDRRERLNELSIEAHKQALELGRATPAEMMEFSHLPMLVVNGIPKLRGDRMRDDQVEDAIEILEYRIGRRKRTTSIYEQVVEHMGEFGAAGLRLQDVVAAVGQDKKYVRKALLRMAEEGTVYIAEEPTRLGGSPRKRYWFGLPQRLLDTVDFRRPGDRELLNAELMGVVGMDITSTWIPVQNEHDSGIIHHGTSVAGVSCTCWPCTDAFRNELVGGQVSVARALGLRKRAFELGVELCAIRRRELEEAVRGA